MAVPHSYSGPMPFLAILLFVLAALAANVATPAPKPTVITLIEYSYDTRLLASVKTAGPSATTYSLGCPSSQGTTCFNYGNGIPTVTVVAGPSTAAQTLSIEEIDLTIQVTCRLTATNPSYGGPCVQNVKSGSLSDSTSFDAERGMWATFVGITVTAGLDKLDVATTSSTEATSGSEAPASKATSAGESHSHSTGESSEAPTSERSTTVALTTTAGASGVSAGPPTTTAQGNAGTRSLELSVRHLVVFLALTFAAFI